MGDQIIAYAKEYFYFVIIVGGAIIVIGCIFNWQWAARIISPSKMPFIRGFIEGFYGTEVRYKFERAVSFICGVFLILIGLFYWHVYG